MQINTENFGEVTLTNFTKSTKDELLYVLKMRNHPEIKKWMYNQEDISEHQHFDFVEKLKFDETKEYFIVKQNESIFGSINFTNIDFAASKANFGLYANPFLSIAGAGRILEESSLRYAKDVLKLSYLNLEVFEENTQAINFYRKNGFVDLASKKVNKKIIICMQKIIEEK